LPDNTLRSASLTYLITPTFRSHTLLCMLVLSVLMATEVLFHWFRDGTLVS